MRVSSLIIAASTLAFLPQSANAAVTYLDFEGIAPYPNSNDVSIDGFYNGGTSSNGSSGTNLGVNFTSTALLLCLNTSGVFCSNVSKGGLGIPTSQFGALFFPYSNPIMNVSSGFDTGFSFTYSSPFDATTSVKIYDGSNGTGSLLASAVLPLTTNSGCAPAISGGVNYCPFNPFSVAFSGNAMSVVFGGAPNYQVFDDFTFGSTAVGGAVPEPATWMMMFAGFGALGAGLRRRRAAIKFA